VDAAWCVEKGDLVAVCRFVARVCDTKDCRKRARLSCTRILECGHRCGGVRGERLCLPCLEVPSTFLVRNVIFLCIAKASFHWGLLF